MGDKALLFLGNPDKVILFVLPLDNPLDVDSPGSVDSWTEAELTEGNPVLHRPSLPVDLRLPLPDPVPGFIGVAVVVENPIVDGSSRRERELVPCASVLIGIQGEGDRVRFFHLVPSAETGDDLGRLLIEETGCYVESLFIKGNPKFGLFRRLSPVGRVALYETAHPWPLPDSFAQLPIHLYLFGRLEGFHNGRNPPGIVGGPSRERYQCQKNKPDENGTPLSHSSLLKVRYRLYTL